MDRRALRAQLLARVPEQAQADYERAQRIFAAVNPADILVSALHREDVLGRDIHEAAYAMQVPSFGPDDCWACRDAARRLIEALEAEDVILESHNRAGGS